MVAVALGLTMMTAPVQAWELNSPYKDDLTIRHNVEMFISDASEEMDVAFTAITKIGKKSDDGIKVSFGWEGLEAGGQVMEDMMFDGNLDGHGFLKSMDDGDDMRNMWAPFFFVYPGQAVEKGSEWSAKDKEEGLSFTFEAMGVKKLKETETMHVKMKFKSASSSSVSGDGEFWVRKDGMIMKYEIDVSNWFIPMAGQVFDGSIEGVLDD